MPPVSFKAVESFSSEDPNYPASNLLKPGNKKWKCRQAGEQQAYVVLRLEEPTQITGIDIGNEHSALIEVLVARSGPSNPSFSEILLATKFMNAIDSRNSTGTSGVQCFNASVLIPSVASEKWDLVKFICTQPFNSRVRYGLTFVALHTNSGAEKRERKSLVPEKFQQQIREEANRPKQASVGLNLGRFKLREESPDSDDAGFSNIFSRWKNSNATSSTTARPTVSALMRDTNTPNALQKNIPTPGSVRSVAKQRPNTVAFVDSDEEEVNQPANASVKVNRNDESVLYDAEDDKPTKKRNESAAVRSESRGQREPTTPKLDAKNVSKVSKVSSSKFKDFLDLSGSNHTPKRNDERKSSGSTPVVAKKEHSNTSSLSARNDTPYKSIDHARPPLSIEKQTVSSSKRFSSPTKSPGNNHDSTLPTMKKPKLTIVDDESETEEVKRPIRYKPFGKLLENVVLVISGIQNPDRANVRSQALAMGAKYKPDWDAFCTHLICAYKNTPKYNQVHGKGKIVKKDWIEKCYTNRKRLSWRKFALDTAEANVSDSEGEIVDIANKPNDAVEPAERRSTPPPPLVENATEEPVMLHELSDTDEEPDATIARRVYDKSTEDEGDHREDNTVGSLDFFKGKKFYLHQELGAVDMIKLEKYIESFMGAVSKEMVGVDYVIARSKHTLPFNSRAELVKPLWVYECNDMECLIPVNRYRIV